MTPPDGSAAEALDAFDAESPLQDTLQATVLAFPGAFSAAAGFCPPPVNIAAAALPPDLAQALNELAQERGSTAAALLDAARLLIGAAAGPEGDIAAAETALAAAGRGPRRVVATAEIDRLHTRVDMLEYRGKALTDALARVSFQPLTGGLQGARDAAQIFGFANEWCFDEDRVTRRFRELAPVYHPDTGVVADRERMAQLIEARNLLIRHVRTAYASGGWVGKRRG